MCCLFSICTGNERNSGTEGSPIWNMWVEDSFSLGDAKYQNNNHNISHDWFHKSCRRNLWLVNARRQTDAIAGVVRCNDDNF